MTTNVAVAALQMTLVVSIGKPVPCLPPRKHTSFFSEGVFIFCTRDCLDLQTYCQVDSLGPVPLANLPTRLDQQSTRSQPKVVMSKTADPCLLRVFADPSLWLHWPELRCQFLLCFPMHHLSVYAILPSQMTSPRSLDLVWAVVPWKLRNNNLDIRIPSYDCAPIINQSGLQGIWRGRI